MNLFYNIPKIDMPVAIHQNLYKQFGSNYIDVYGLMCFFQIYAVTFQS